MKINQCQCTERNCNIHPGQECQADHAQTIYSTEQSDDPGIVYGGSMRLCNKCKVEWMAFANRITDNVMDLSKELLVESIDVLINTRSGRTHNRQSQFQVEHNLDTDASDRARAVHRIVRAMHDGECPNCGTLDEAAELRFDGDEYNADDMMCLHCKFSISQEEQKAAIREFSHIMKKSLKVFLEWREAR